MVKPPSQPAGFTLIEMLTALAVLVLMLTMIVSVVTHTSSVTTRATQKISAFQGARSAFDRMTRTLQQATLNSYWDFDTGSKKFRRNSELHFLSGQFAQLSGRQSATRNHPPTAASRPGDHGGG